MICIYNANIFFIKKQSKTWRTLGLGLFTYNICSYQVLLELLFEKGCSKLDCKSSAFENKNETIFPHPYLVYLTGFLQN